MPDNRWRVVLASASDADGIANVYCRAWKKAYRNLLPDEVLERLEDPDWPGRFRESIELGQNLLLVVKDGAEVAGMLEFKKADREVRCLYVDPDYWGQGIGSELLRGLIAFCREEGVSSILLWSLPGNEVAAKFYRKSGFKLKPGVRSLVFGGQDYPLCQYQLDLEADH